MKGSKRNGTSKLRQIICLLNIYWYQKQLAPELKPFKTLIVWGSNLANQVNRPLPTDRQH